MKMKGRNQGRRIAYQSQIQRVYTTHLDLGKGRDASSGTRRGNKNKQHTTSDIGIHNSNSHQIASALVGDHQLRDSHQIPTK